MRRELVAVIVVAGLVAGASIGTYGFDSSGRLFGVFFAAIKVPLLLLTAAAIALPGFFVISTVRGLRGDWPAVLAGILQAQAVIAVVLAAIGPITMFLYLSGLSYRYALLWNGVVFLIATTVGQAVLRRACANLVKSDPRHRAMLRLWTVMYAFVGIQMGWTLRPFLGAPGAVPTFFRDEPFTNAYVVVLKLIFG